MKIFEILDKENEISIGVLLYYEKEGTFIIELQVYWSTRRARAWIGHEACVCSHNVGLLYSIVGYSIFYSCFLHVRRRINRRLRVNTIIRRSPCKEVQLSVAWPVVDVCRLPQGTFLCGNVIHIMLCAEGAVSVLYLCHNLEFVVHALKHTGTCGMLLIVGFYSVAHYSTHIQSVGRFIRPEHIIGRSNVLAVGTCGIVGIGNAKADTISLAFAKRV